MFQMKHSSPRHPQSNGFIEAMVNTTKNIMEKAEESGSEPHLAMLIYRSTPIRPDQLSPAELLTQRKYRALLLIHQNLHPNLEKSREAQRAQVAQKQTQVNYCNQKAKQPRDLKQYQNVRVHLDPNKPVWQKATVMQQPTDRSPRRYEVQCNSERPKSRSSCAPTSPPTNIVNQTLPMQSAQDHTHPSIATYRLLRIIRPPMIEEV